VRSRYGRRVLNPPTPDVGIGQLIRACERRVVGDSGCKRADWAAKHSRNLIGNGDIGQRDVPGVGHGEAVPQKVTDIWTIPVQIVNRDDRLHQGDRWRCLKGECRWIVGRVVRIIGIDAQGVASLSASWDSHRHAIDASARVGHVGNSAATRRIGFYEGRVLHTVPVDICLVDCVRGMKGCVIKGPRGQAAKGPAGDICQRVRHHNVCQRHISGVGHFEVVVDDVADRRAGATKILDPVDRLDQFNRWFCSDPNRRRVITRIVRVVRQNTEWIVGLGTSGVGLDDTIRRGPSVGYVGNLHGQACVGVHEGFASAVHRHRCRGRAVLDAAIDQVTFNEFIVKGGAVGALTRCQIGCTRHADKPESSVIDRDIGERSLSPVRDSKGVAHGVACSNQAIAIVDNFNDRLHQLKASVNEGHCHGCGRGLQTSRVRGGVGELHRLRSIVRIEHKQRRIEVCNDLTSGHSGTVVEQVAVRWQGDDGYRRRNSVFGVGNNQLRCSDSNRSSGVEHCRGGDILRCRRLVDPNVCFDDVRAPDGHSQGPVSGPVVPGTSAEIVASDLPARRK